MKRKITIKNKPKTKLRLSVNLLIGAVIASSLIAIVSILIVISSIGITESAMAEKGGQSNVFVSVLDGDWNDPISWSSVKGIVPDNKDDITVDDSIVLNGDINLQNSLAVTVNADLTLGYLEIKNGATLYVAGVLRVDSLEFDNGSAVNIAEGATISISGGFVNRNNSNNVIIDGDITVGGDFYNGNHGIVDGLGSITVAGNYLGDGTTFGISPNSSIPGGSKVPSTLPIELIEFVVKQKGESVMLSWSTATELNNDYFTIERSINGVDFFPIQYIEGNGTTNYKINYEYIDCDAVEGRNYYKLTQTDFDGGFEQFDIKVVEVSREINSEIIIDNVYPNPFVNNCNIEFITSDNNPVEVFVINMSGIIVKTLQINSSIGYNAINLNNLGDLSNGSYMLYLVQNNVKTDAYKVMKK